MLQKLHTRTLVRKYVKGITPEKKAQVSLWLVRCWVIDGQPLRHMVGEMERLNYEVTWPCFIYILIIVSTFWLVSILPTYWFQLRLHKMMTDLSSNKSSFFSVGNGWQITIMANKDFIIITITIIIIIMHLSRIEHS